MRILYVEVPGLVERFGAVCKALREQARRIPDVRLEVVSLSHFLEAFAAHTPDLVVAECDASQFAAQFEAFQKHGVDILRGGRDVWTAMDRDAATPGLWFAMLGGVPLVFVYDQDPLAGEVLALHLDFKRVVSNFKCNIETEAIPTIAQASHGSFRSCPC